MPKSSLRSFALSAAYVEWLHDEVVPHLWPGKDPIRPSEYRSQPLLDSAANRPFQTAFGQELFENVFCKAAALFHALISNHPFNNGNKRAAVLALDHFLLANGYFPALDDDEMYELATGTATYKERGLSHETIVTEIADLLKNRCVSFRTIRKILSKAEYEEILAARRLIRSDKLNRRQPGQRDSPL